MPLLPPELDEEWGDEVFALMPFDRDGAAADYVVVPAAVLVVRLSYGKRRASG